MCLVTTSVQSPFTQSYINKSPICIMGQDAGSRKTLLLGASGYPESISYNSVFTHKDQSNGIYLQIRLLRATSCVVCLCYKPMCVLLNVRCSFLPQINLQISHLTSWKNCTALRWWWTLRRAASHPLLLIRLPYTVWWDPAYLFLGKLSFLGCLHGFWQWCFDRKAKNIPRPWIICNEGGAFHET